MLYAPHFLNGFLLSVVLVFALKKAAIPAGLIDIPTGRKSHHGMIPVIGGVAMFVAFTLATFLLPSSLKPPAELEVALLLLVVLGLADDLYDLRASTRLAIQSLAALVLVLPHWRVISELGHFPDDLFLNLHAFALPFTLVFVIGMINAFNMLDGLDGLAGGAAAAAFFWLAATAVHAGSTEFVILALLLMVTLGFLVFNLRHPWQVRASVFMGDAGSTMLGAAIAFYVASFGSGTQPIASFAALLWLCALPAIDTLSLIIRRILAGDSPMKADRRHLHHLLMDAGLSQSAASGSIIALSFIMGGIGFAGIVLGVPDMVMAIGLLVPVLLHTWFVCHDRRIPLARARAQPIGALQGALSRRPPSQGVL